MAGRHPLSWYFALGGLSVILLSQNMGIPVLAGFLGFVGMTLVYVARVLNGTSWAWMLAIPGLMALVPSVIEFNAWTVLLFVAGCVSILFSALWVPKDAHAHED